MPTKSVANIRQRFNIKGHEWRVQYKHNLTSEEHGPCEGELDPANRIIWIERSLPPDRKYRAFIHELIHAIHFEAHATEAGGVDGFLGEVLAESCTDTLLTLFTLEWKGARKGRKPKQADPTSVVEVKEPSNAD